MALDYVELELPQNVRRGLMDYAKGTSNPSSYSHVRQADAHGKPKRSPSAAVEVKHSHPG